MNAFPLRKEEARIVEVRSRLPPHPFSHGQRRQTGDAPDRWPRWPLKADLDVKAELVESLLELAAGVVGDEKVAGLESGEQFGVRVAILGVEVVANSFGPEEGILKTEETRQRPKGKAINGGVPPAPEERSRRGNEARTTRSA